MPPSDVLAPDDDTPDQQSVRQGGPREARLIAGATLDEPFTDQDLEHGFAHLADLFAFDPSSSFADDLFERYVARRRTDPLSLAGHLQTGYFAHEALRARLLHLTGETNQAVDVLVQVAQVKPAVGYLEAWAVGWLSPTGVFESLGADRARYFLVTALNSLPEHDRLTVRQHRRVLSHLPLARRFGDAFGLTPVDAMSVAGLLRKAGQFDEGLAFIRAQPDGWHTAVAEGLLLREQGVDPDASEAAFRRALDHDPSDLSAALEAGDLFLQRRDWARARRWYEWVTSREPGQPWAAPSARYCAWQEGGGDLDDAAFEELRHAAQSDGGRAAELVGRHLNPFWGRLGEFHDATANVVRQVADMVRADGPESFAGSALNVQVSSLESPSVQLAWRAHLAAWGIEAELDVTVEDVPSPDPREPVRPVSHLLWAYDGTTSSPALPAPATEIADLVAELATRPYDWAVNWASASRAAARLPSSAAPDLLATMVHPPAPPTDTEGIAWVCRVQLTAAQVLAHLDEGWEASVRRDALVSALLGPRDWTTGAAAIVLAALANDEPVLVDDIRQLFATLAAHRGDDDAAAYLEPLYAAWLALPQNFDREVAELRRRLAAG